ncbi:hypothetical protein H0H92_009871 [Tricholoma furcatifolium]|nr:hypothetical protein H0H92_009871 [Tricholoma furcatifolium]
MYDPNLPLLRPTVVYYIVPVLRPHLVYYFVPVLVMPAPASANSFAARHRGTTSRYHPYVRKVVTARPPRHASNVPVPVQVVPPHPLDPMVAIHPPLSPREIFRRQQERQRRRLEALFCIPQFKKVVMNGFYAAMMEVRASMSDDVLREGASQSANTAN